jgi:hypothetical protein
MERYVAKKSGVRVPRALATLFANPALVGDETREDYDDLFHAIVAVVKPKDAIAWLFAGRLTDLSWELKRERNLKRLVLKYAYQGEVRRLLTLLSQKDAFSLLSQKDAFCELGIISPCRLDAATVPTTSGQKALLPIEQEVKR